MKVGGIVLIVIGTIIILMFLIAGLSGVDQSEKAGQTFVYGIGFVGFGIYLINRSNSRKKELIEKEEWEKGNKPS